MVRRPEVWISFAHAKKASTRGLRLICRCFFRSSGFISELGVQMVYGANPLGRLVSDRIFGCLMILFRQCLQGIGKIPSRMGSAPCENDGLTFPVQLPVGGVSATDNGACESFQEFPRMVCFPGLLVFIQDNGCIPISLSRPVNPHVTLAVCRAPILRYPDQSLIGLQHMETVCSSTV